MKKSIFKNHPAYKPFQYPWAYQAYVESEQAHWLVREVPLNEDVKDWKKTLNAKEKHLLTQIFRFFTQADCDIAKSYIDVYLPAFKTNEIRMMLLSMAARECVHIQAYSTLIDEVGMPETEYSMFMEYEAMVAKHNYMSQEREGLEGLAHNMAVFSAFGEGLQLFSSFVILLNFTRVGKMKGMGQIISWSIRDESHHVESMLRLFHTFMDEHPELWTADFKAKLYRTAIEMVDLEDKFIDLAYSQGEVDGLSADEVKQYIRHIADRRLLQLGLKPNYGVKKNPLPWVDVIVNGKEHTNFFENKPTAYTKAGQTGNWENAFE